MEMETTNLLISKRGDLVSKLLKSYSTTLTDRHNLVQDLILSANPFRMDININKDGVSTNRQILQKYLNVLDIQLDD